VNYTPVNCAFYKRAWRQPLAALRWLLLALNRATDISGPARPCVDGDEDEEKHFSGDERSRRRV